MNWIDSQSATIDHMVEDAHNAARLLQERRTALISAALTGQVGVRGAAAQDSEPTQAEWAAALKTR